MIYGGNGHAAHGGYGPECNFMFPGVTDTLNWGCGCQLPNGTVNWTEMMAGNNPSDRRGMASMGPFTFNPGGVQEVDLAFTYARTESGTPWESVELLQTMIDSVRSAYRSNILPDGQSFNGISNSKKGPSLHINLFPNPASGNVTIDFHQMINELIHIDVINSSGNVVSAYDLNPGTSKAVLNVTSFANGLYMVIVRAKTFTATAKFSVIR